MLPDLSSTPARRPLGWLVLTLGTALLSACAAPAPSAPAPSPVPASPAALPPVVSTPPMPVAAVPPANVPAPVSPGPAPAAMAEMDAGTQPVLRYAERLRSLSPGELTLEIATLGEPGADVQRQMQLALALMHTHQPVDTAKALGLLQRVAAGTAADPAGLRPLARLLAGRLLEQRKLEDANDRQAQQLREQQRRIDQLTDRLEAMRAIERSLTTRPPAAPRAAPPGATP